MISPLGPIYYGDYLKLDQLTNLQEPKSKEIDREAHDETLFIIVHQVYELWFKQILHEFHAIHKDMSREYLEDKELTTINARLARIIKIQGLLIDQLDVMETMTPMDFLEFRDLLVPASGFQSVQFREIEIMSGLSTDNRIEVDRDFFLGRLSEKDRKRIAEIEKLPSLLNLVEKWLERLPFTNQKNFDFWKAYKKSVESMLDQDEEIVRTNWATLSEANSQLQLAGVNSTRESFNYLFDEAKHKEAVASGQRRLSQKAILNALFILLYRDEPMLQIPYQFLTALMDIDENFTTWRYKHSIMAHRMLGEKIGTGGSSGHHYLKRAAENNRVYLDLFNLSTFLIPRSSLPELPPEVKEALNFNYRRQ